MSAQSNYNAEMNGRALGLKRKNVGGKREIRRGLFDALDAAGEEQGAHLGDGDVVEGGEAFGLWQALVDEDSAVKAEFLKAESRVSCGELYRNCEAWWLGRSKT